MRSWAVVFVAVVAALAVASAAKAHLLCASNNVIDGPDDSAVRMDMRDLPEFTDRCGGDHV